MGDGRAVATVARAGNRLTSEHATAFMPLSVSAFLVLCSLKSELGTQGTSDFFFFAPSDKGIASEIHEEAALNAPAKNR